MRFSFQWALKAGFKEDLPNAKPHLIFSFLKIKTTYSLVSHWAANFQNGQLFFLMHSPNFKHIYWKLNYYDHHHYYPPLHGFLFVYGEEILGHRGQLENGAFYQVVNIIVSGFISGWAVTFCYTKLNTEWNQWLGANMRHKIVLEGRITVV